MNVRLANAFNAVILWVKCAKYIGFVPFLRVVLSTILSAMTLLAPLIVLVVVAFIGYVTVYHVAFNTYLVQVSSFWSTSLFLGRAFLRDLDLMPLFRVSPFFASFMIL